MKNSIFVFLFLGGISPLFCQESPFLYNVQNKVNKAIENYQNGSYSLAYNILNEVLTEDQFASDPRWKEIRVLALAIVTRSTFKLSVEEGELISGIINTALANEVSIIGETYESLEVIVTR